MSDSLLQNLFERPSTSLGPLDRVPIAGASYVEADISGATQANPVVLTITGHPFQNGDLIYITGVGGMTQLNGNTYTVANRTTNTVELTSGGSNVNGTGFSAYTSGGKAILGRLQYARLTNLVNAIAYTRTQTDVLLSLKADQTDVNALARSLCMGRLTTESGVGVSSSDRTAQSTLFWTPWNGNLVGLFDGSQWNLHTFTQRSLSLSGLTAGRNYDVFLFSNSGTLTLELSAAWTNDTTRADALSLQDGVYVKSGAATRRWLGTIRTTGTNTTEDSDAKRFVWNKYNQVIRRCYFIDTTTHSYASGLGTRQWRAQSSNQIDFVVGETQTLALSLVCRTAGGAGPPYAIASFGINSTSTESSAIYNPIVPEHAEHGNRIQSFVPGRHFVALLQRSEVASVTYYQGELGALLAC